MSEKEMWDRFIRLGEMIGDGDHADMKNLKREYKRLMLILIPETKVDLRTKAQERNRMIDEAVRAKLAELNCPKCNAVMRQVRSGSLTVKCSNCESKYKFKKKK